MSRFNKPNNDMENELFGENHEQEENGLFGKQHAKTNQLIIGDVCNSVCFIPDNIECRFRNRKGECTSLGDCLKANDC